jgi:hypothetical protein
VHPLHKTVNANCLYLVCLFTLFNSVLCLFTLCLDDLFKAKDEGKHSAVIMLDYS